MPRSQLLVKMVKMSDSEMHKYGTCRSHVTIRRFEHDVYITPDSLPNKRACSTADLGNANYNRLSWRKETKQQMK
jgi:hypothetical protein